MSGRSLDDGLADGELWACRAGVDLIGLYGIDAPRFRAHAVSAARWRNVETAHAAVVDGAAAQWLSSALRGAFDPLSGCQG